MRQADDELNRIQKEKELNEIQEKKVSEKSFAKIPEKKSSKDIKTASSVVKEEVEEVMPVVETRNKKPQEKDSKALLEKLINDSFIKKFGGGKGNRNKVDI